MENKYLNEERYQQSKKKITKLSIIILIVGLVIGAALIVTGVIKQNNAKKINEQRYNEAYALSEKNVAKANERLSTIESEVEELNLKADEKNRECDSLNMSDPNWFSDVNSCHREAGDLEQQVSKLEMEKFELENANYTVYYDEILPSKYNKLYIFGAIIIAMACIAALGIYLIAKRREMLAFGVQQIMPVAKEGIEEITPIIGKAGATIAKELAPAYGEVAKELASGIKDGLKDDNNNQ